MFTSSDTNDIRLVYDKIPVRNVWFLFLYAHDLVKFRGKFDAEIETSPDFKSLIARLLCYTVENRLRRNLSFGYRHREDTLRRVRGRIDMLQTETRALLSRGEIACRFEELTIDTPRNRLVRAALSVVGGVLDNDRLRHRTKMLAGALGSSGVSAVNPSRGDMATDQIGRHEAEDRLMVSLARAVFDLVLPTEETGTRSVLDADRAETEFRKLFERAIGNFFNAELSREDGWRVYPGKKFKWPIDAASSGIRHFLPIMVTDIILENEREDRRIIIDTKFTNVFIRSQHGGALRFKSAHIYQLYAYLRSQERHDEPRSLSSEGLLLYPAIGSNIDETAEIQGHHIRFATIDLMLPALELSQRLRAIPMESRLCRPVLPSASHSG
ncbi:5-methylcytosine-specific restriction endonuclease system specificity protein McrC [Thalassospira lucentensis]|uniref:5-methylcytosine-specific restriction endonuclease system specificity protein McrC n=1 Tax=Thalassospira lucentensis TaxID=168935 RepID=UPI00142D697E|nr:5-methylcytosine-specific restriction endonuclease system specificity protein McrC [Thalassospira lucentensis]NIZ01921.1 5-methylcytosine-specific restriction endonuclease system specificity protein McrC [Thalassospira lucentensis]